MTDRSPEVTDRSPEVTDRSPEVTDRSPEVDAPRPDEVRRSLRALAHGSASSQPSNAPAPDETVSPDPESVVRDAERAADSAREAASFLSAGRLPDLDRAVATAVRRDEDDTTARGRAARKSLRRLDAALRGGESTTPRPTTPPADHDATTSTPVAERF
ncbi:hypothetical protein [Halobellus salinus]|uniref:hypothetical protein n=1 Tax=Halobellus salinus TaxID=931585 RepID=UPI00166D0C57|nr:hypothetical protein [Halobellus salinus]SMP32812.1 hypothetical protein SAMN06265347_12136 [Halobellus salinus]